MTMQRLRVGILVAGVLSAWAAAAQEGAPGKKPLWSVLEKLLAQDAVKPASPGLDPAAPADRQFLFDEVLALEPEGMMRGAAFIIAKNAAPADPAELPAHTRRVEAQLQALFEYYPLIAKSPEDFTLLTDAIISGAQPPALRVFLLRRCAPGLAAESGFGAYMQECLSGGNATFEAALAKIIQNPTEVPALQYEAVRVVGPLVANAFAALLARDPSGAEHQKKTGTPLQVSALIGAPEAIPLTRPTQTKVAEKAQAAGGMAAILLAVARDPGRSPEMRATAGEVAAQFIERFPLPNREELQARTAQEPPNPPAIAPAP